MSKLRFGAMSLALAGSMIALSGTVLADGPRYSIKDTPAPAPFSWTGFYVGLNAGYAWGNSDLASSFTCPVTDGTCPYNVPLNQQRFSSDTSGTSRSSGFTGGGQAGYNWQMGNIVLGAETDFNAFHLSRTIAGGGPIPSTGLPWAGTASVDTDWLFTLRGRAGWTVLPQILLYATGGLAVTKLEVGNTFSGFNFAPGPTPAPTPGSSSQADTKAGWTVGGGLEWAIDRNWSLKSEYLFVNFGTVGTTARVNGVVNGGGGAVVTPNVFTTTGDLNAHIARVGLNYKF